MNSFNMKVSDLLKNPGQTDLVTFNNIQTEKIPGLTEDGISGDINLQSINDSTIRVTLENISCKINDQCDVCLEDYQRDVLCEEYRAKFEIPNEEYKAEEEENFDVNKEEIFPLNPRSESIDLEDMIVQSVILQAPFTKKCENCKNKEDEIEDDTDMGLGSGNIVFS